MSCIISIIIIYGYTSFGYLVINQETGHELANQFSWDDQDHWPFKWRENKRITNDTKVKALWKQESRGSTKLRCILTINLLLSWVKTFNFWFDLILMNISLECRHACRQSCFEVWMSTLIELQWKWPNFRDNISRIIWLTMKLTM